MAKQKPNWTDREKGVLLEEYEKRKVSLKAKFSSSITSADKTRVWQEITNIINAGNLVKRECESAFPTTCTLIEWYPFLFTNWSSCCEGAIIRTCVPSIRPKIFGKLPMS